MKKIIYPYRILWSALFVLVAPLFFVSCEKEEKKVELIMVDPTDVNIEINADEYAEKIKEKTGFIASITTNNTIEAHPGLQETHVTLVDTSGKPLALYFFTVDLSNSNISMEVATPQDLPNFALQTVRTQAIRKNEALVNRGTPNRHVIGALNGDYWDVSGEYTSGTPLGPVIKNKVVIKDEFLTTANYYFLSILINGRVMIGDRAMFPTISNMKETLGGRYLLVYDGEDRTASLNTNVEPRTAVGVFNMNKLVFMVVDGRNSSHSVGITMAGLAKIFMAIGVKDAINLDGGGSSTFVSFDKTANDLVIKNKYSDANPRNVANSWTIIGNK